MKNEGNNIPLSRQVKYFRATWSKMVASNGSEAVSALLSRSVILIGIGGNDISAFENAEQARNRSAAERHDDDVAVYYGSLISVYSATITVRNTATTRASITGQIILPNCCLVSIIWHVC